MNGFADRMQLIKDTISPKLSKLGELLQPQLSRAVDHEIYPQVAEHARRTVNPPTETWVAFGPDPIGYKSYVHFALCVGGVGVQARVTAKQECKNRKIFGQNLMTYAEQLKDLKGNREMADYSKSNGESPETISDWVTFFKETGQRLKQTQTSVFDIGINLPLSGDLSSHAIQAFCRLSPFYKLGGNHNNNPPRY
ncbi:MAG: DUF1054 family protein [Deltaproteobacteria bacterium]|nr:DUF1054 family protein [Deltaproteobacteria bacterium]